MYTQLVAFALAFAVAAMLTPLLRALAPLVGGVDKVQARKVHTRPTPRIGGVAIVLAFFVPLVGLLLYETEVGRRFLADVPRVVGLFVGGLAIALLGFYDDLHGLGAKQKFAVQTAVAVLMYALGYRIDAISHPFADAAIPLGAFSLPFTVVWIVGIINAMNLIDGLDGLAGGVAIIAVGLIFVVSKYRPDDLMCLFMASLGGALLGFLLYNFNPATIFMGDTGSMFLGFVLASTAITSSQKSSTTVAMLVPIIGLGLPIADTLLAMVRRALRGRPLFSADKDHIHHRLLALGLSHRQAVLVLYGVCLAFAGAAWGLTRAKGGPAAAILAVLGAASVALLRLLGYLATDPVSRSLDAQLRERNLRLRGQLKGITDALRNLSEIDAGWEVVKPLAPALDLHEMTLTLVLSEVDGETTRSVHLWRSSHAVSPYAVPCLARFDLVGTGELAGADLGALDLMWRDGRREMGRDDEIFLERLTSELAATLTRLRLSQAPPVRSNVIALRRPAGSE